MAVVQVGEVWESRRGSIDEMFIRRYTRVFRVLTNATTDGPQNVRTASGPNGAGVNTTIPALGEIWTDGSVFDSGARCYSILPQQDQDDPKAWLVVCEYTSDRPDGTNRNPALFVQAGSNPILHPPEVRFDYEMYRRVVTTDIYGQAITNSVGLPFDPPIEIDAHRMVLTIEWNSLTYDPVGSVKLHDAINLDVWLGFPQYTAKIRKYGGELRYQDGLIFWRRQAEVELRYGGPLDPQQPDGSWLLQIYDHGNQIYNPSNGKIENALDPNGQPYTGTVLLAGDGSLLAHGATPYTYYYHGYQEVAFSSLDWPDISSLLTGQPLN